MKYGSLATGCRGILDSVVYHVWEFAAKSWGVYPDLRVVLRIAAEVSEFAAKSWGVYPDEIKKDFNIDVNEFAAKSWGVYPDVTQ